MTEEEVRLPNVLKTAKNWENRRVYLNKKPGSNFKAPEKLFRKEVRLACVMGELSALERILQVIVNHPEMTREDVEAEIHVAIKDYNNYLSSSIGREDLQIEVEDILITRGYIKPPQSIQYVLEE